MSVFPEKSFTDANDVYVKAYTKEEGELPLPPGKRYAIVTCQDARLDPAKAFGISLGEAHVIRNAGGDAADSIRSLVISQQMLGTNAIFLVKHTDCGMIHFENKDIHKKIRENLGVSANNIDFRPFSDIKKAVRDDVAFLKGHELIHPAVKSHISGWIYHVETGKVEKVV